MNQKNLQMAVFALSDDYPGLTPEALEKALTGINSGADMEIWLTTREAAAMLGIHPCTVKQMCYKGVLRRVRRSYRDNRIARSSIVEYLERCDKEPDRFANMGPNVRKATQGTCTNNTEKNKSV